MSPTEQRYAQIEKEALAFTWACERLSNYLMGKKFHIHTDHKPLVPLFSTKHLEELPIRVQRFRLRMMRFDYTISHVPGKNLIIADTLSRAPSMDVTESDCLFQKEVDCFVNAVLYWIACRQQRNSFYASDSINRKMKCAKQLPRTVNQGGQRNIVFLTKYVHTTLYPLKYQSNKACCCEVEESSFRQCFEKRCLEKSTKVIWEYTKCRERARQSIWWPGMSTELEKVVKNCVECCKTQKQRHQPLIPSPLPDLPWQRVATDLYEWKQQMYLLVVDYYSRYIEIARLNKATADEVILHTKSIFARHGIPEEVISDNGSQYTSAAYQRFAQEFQFHHVTSSPYFPQSNGEAERAVGTIKNLLKKNDDPYLALLAYRATPLENGYSPSELLMSRRLRTTLLASTWEQRKPSVPNGLSMQAKDQQLKIRQKENFDTRRGVRELSPLQLGETVWMTDRNCEAQVSEEVATRSYEVMSQEGIFRRNRRDLNVLPNPETDQSVAEHPKVPQQQQQQQTGENPTGSQPLRRSTRTAKTPNRLDPSWT